MHAEVQFDQVMNGRAFIGYAARRKNYVQDLQFSLYRRDDMPLPGLFSSRAHCQFGSSRSTVGLQIWQSAKTLCLITLAVSV
jgi:hypothetical protein